MTPCPSPFEDATDMLEHLLQEVPRRHRGEASWMMNTSSWPPPSATSPLTTSPTSTSSSTISTREPVFAADAIAASARLAIALESARHALDHHEPLGPSLREEFIAALAHLIHDALHHENGDPMFRMAMLREAPEVQAFEALRSTALHDARQVRNRVDAVAHPGKWRSTPRGEAPQTITRLHELARSGSWAALRHSAAQLQAQLTSHDDLSDFAQKLASDPALARLERLHTLEAGAQEPLASYLAMQRQLGPRAGSAAARHAGLRSRDQGAAMEARTALAFQALTEWLNAEDTAHEYRVVNGLRLPASLLGDTRHAKAEWDTVLLLRARRGAKNSARNGEGGRASEGEVDDSCDSAGKCEGNSTSSWCLRLLVEAKSSIDAAITDYPGLLRGLRLLAQASADTDHCFQWSGGSVQICGASLAALATTAPGRLPVVYCCNAAPEAAPRPLSTASRMQLLTLPGSLAYATALMKATPDTTGEPDMKGNPDTQAREALLAAWEELISSPRYHTLLNQLPLQRQVRERIIHTDDLLRVVGRHAAPTGTTQSPM